MAIATHLDSSSASASKGVEYVARIGYATKAVVYALVGALAFLTAIGQGGSVGGSQNAVETIGQQSYGQVLLFVTALGLFAYAAWRLVQASFDPEHKGSDKEGVVKRLGYAGSGLVYGGLAVSTIQMAIGSSSSGGGRETWIRKIMSVDTVGPILIGVAALVVLGVGLFQFYKAYTAKFVDKLKSGEMSSSERTWVERLGRLGLSARGVVFLIIGGYAMKGAIAANSGSIKTTGEALAEIASQPQGAILLGLTALGFVAYAIYQAALARYRKIPA